MRLIQSGPKSAKLVVVGEAPGATEDASGVPFSGASGNDLNNYLIAVGIARSDVFATNVCHERPPANKFEAFLKPKPHPALLYGIVQLKKDIEEIRPNLVLALGDVPLRFLTNKRSITKYRGSVLESTLVKGQKILPTFHPASVFRQYENRALIRLDMKRVAEEVKFPEIILPVRDIRVWPDGSEWIEEMFRAEWLSFDIETNQRFEILCIGFSDRPDRALVVPRTALGHADVWRRLLSSPAKKCGQNAGQFDCTVLEDRGYEVVNFCWDIMFSHHALLLEAASGGDEVKALRGGKQGARSPLAKGLAFQASIYTKEPYWKDSYKVWNTNQ